MIRSILVWSIIVVLKSLAFPVMAQTFNGQGGLLIPPGAPGQTVGITTSVATVSGIGILGTGCSYIDFVTLDLVHSWDGDIAIFLIAPTGQVLEFSSGNGGAGDNFQITVFTDNTPLFITQGAPPFNGPFRPEGRQTNTVPPFSNANPLGTFTFQNTFNGLNADGDWTLLVNDYVALDVGVINAWSITFSVGGGPVPVVSLGPDITICAGQSTILTADVTPAADSYLWNTGAITSSISVSPTMNTTYMVTVTHNGCIAADTIQVIVDPNGGTANAGPDVNICQGNSTSLTGSGGSGTATYSWSTGQTGTTISVSPGSTTTYTLTVSDGGCTATDQVTVTVNPNPIAEAGPPVSLCQGQSTTLTASGGTQNNHYTWSTGQTGPSIIVNPLSTTLYTVTVNINGCIDTDDVLVTVTPSPTVDAGADITICSGESALLTATGSGGTYLWSTGQTGSSITVFPITTTTYTVTITDSNGCTGTDNLIVMVGDITAGVTPDQSICDGASVILTATGGNMYFWSTGQTGPSISVSPSTTTTYTVTVTQGSCSDEASVVISVFPIPVAMVSPDEEICAGESVILTASGGASYNWSSGQNTNPITVTPGTTTLYTVTVTSNGCSSSASVQVLVNPSPNASAGNDQNICEGESITLTATGLSGPGSYEWNTGQTGASITVMPGITTMYTVTITNQWNCTDTDDITVFVNPIPLANAGPDAGLCDGQSITLTATGGTIASSYTWSNGQSGPTITVSPSQNTTYTVTVTVNGCSSEDAIEVTVQPSPVAFAGLDEEICGGSSIELTASGGGTYQWSTGQNTQMIEVFPPSTSTYTVTVTSANGCTDTDNVTVVVNPNPNADAGPDQTICEGESIILTGSGGGTYNWSTGAGTPVIQVSPSSTSSYTLTVTDFNGCSATDIVTVLVNAIPSVNAGPNVFIIAGESTTLTASGGGTYLWSTGETTDQITVMPGTTTTYTVTVTVNGCIAEDDVTVFVNEIPTVDLGPDLVICEGETAPLDASITGPFTIDYLWSTGETSSTIQVTPLTTTSYSVTATDMNSGFFSTDTMTVTVLTIPIGNPVITGTDVLCLNDQSTYTIEPVTGATSYTWNVPSGAVILTGQGTTSIEVSWTGTPGGEVQLIASNTCGSIPAAILTVSVHTAPLLSGPVSGPSDPCTTGSGDYSIALVPDATAYQWTVTGGASIISGQSTPGITIAWNGVAGGDVCVTASNTCGASSPVCMTVVTTTTPVLDAGSDITVCGLNTALNASGTGAWSLVSGPGSILFDDSNNPLTEIEASTHGVFVLQYAFSQNGCDAMDQVRVEFYELPSLINIEEDCNDINTGYTVSFDIAGGLAPYLINGNAFGGGTFISGQIPSGDMYVFQVSDANGCTTPELSGQNLCLCTSEAGLMDPTPLELCVGAPAMATYLGGSMPDGNDRLAFILHDGNVPGGILGWSLMPVFTFTHPIQTGVIYYISAVIGDEGPGGLPHLGDPCLDVSPGTPVRWHDPPVADAGEDKILGCVSDHVILYSDGSSSGPDINYSWSTENGQIEGPADESIVMATQVGTYILWITDLVSGCQTTDSVRVTPNPFTIANLGITIASPLCFGDCNGIISLTQFQPDWMFDFGDGNFTTVTQAENVCAGSLTISVMDSLGCVLDTMMLIDTPLPVTVDLGPDITISAGDSITLQAMSQATLVQYNWFSAASCTVCPQIVVAPSGTSTYIVEVMDVNQCQATDEVVITVRVTRDISVPNIFSPNGDQVNDVFMIDGHAQIQSIRSMVVYDRWGNVVFEKNNLVPGDPSQGWDGTVNGSPANPGVYVYRVEVLFLTGEPVFLTGDVTLIR